MTRDDRAGTGDASGEALREVDLDSDRLVDLTDDQLDADFRKADTLPLDGLMNVGEHRVDLPARTIYNDAHWKGWVPKDIALRDIFERLSTGYGKRFWKQGGKYLGETLYLQGRILVKHELEEFTLDRQTNDLAPGRYILLKYTDPVFEHIFYDVIRALDDGTILYRGYSGRYPDGKRGLTGLLRRRYGLTHMGVQDHTVLWDAAAAPSTDALEGTWRLHAIATSNLPLTVADVSLERTADGRLESRCTPRTDTPVLVPAFVVEHFTREDASSLAAELRLVDLHTVLGRWTTDIRGPYARLLIGGSLGVFHAERTKGLGRRFTMHYFLSRT
jgi:hypothetical protein